MSRRFRIEYTWGFLSAQNVWHGSTPSHFPVQTWSRGFNHHMIVLVFENSGFSMELVKTLVTWSRNSIGERVFTSAKSGSRATNKSSLDETVKLRDIFG